MRWRCRSSISKQWSSLPVRACFARDPPIELVDFIFLSVRSFFSDVSGLGGSSLTSWRISVTSFRVRRFRNSRAIFSKVVPLFLFGDLGTSMGGCGGAVVGEAGRGLLLCLLPVLLLVDGRSPVAKLTPESARRSWRRYSSLRGFKLSGLVTSRHSSITPLAVRRYLSTVSLTTAQPLASSGRFP